MKICSTPLLPQEPLSWSKRGSLTLAQLVPREWSPSFSWRRQPGGNGFPEPGKKGEKQSSGAIGLHTDPDLLEVSFQVMGMNTRGINDNDSGSAPLPASLSPILTGSSSCTQKQTFLAAAWHCCLLTTMLGTKP